MSKVDALRAMREARYAANQTRRSGTTPSTPSAPRSGATPVPVGDPAAGGGPGVPTNKAPARRASKKAAPAEAVVNAAAPADGAAEDQLCGHKNIGGKTCRRPSGHPEKNHRYV